MAREAAALSAGLLTTQRAEGELFVNGPSLDDPRQGVIGNCYLIAAMAAVAHTAPEQIRDRIRENPDGTFSVRFSEIGKDGKPAEREQKVDRDVLVQGQGAGAGQAVYGASGEKDAAGRPELWVPMMEKAYAQAQGGFEAIGNGGLPGQALEALTGVRAKQQLIGTQMDSGDTAIATNLAKLFKMDPAVTLESAAKARLQQAEKGWDFLKEQTALNNPVVGQTYPDADMIKAGLLPMHAYTVVGCDEKDGKRTVTLRNPAPYRPELDDPKVQEEFAKDPMYGPLVQYLRDNGLTAKDVKFDTFTMPYEEFQRYFTCVNSAPIHQ
jgi:hypothetical protein